MAIPRELLRLYQGLSKKEIFYIRARWFVSPIDAVERSLPLRGRIYDIGCGVGLLSNIAALRSRDREITGIDLSEEKIGIANRSVAGRPNITFKTADALKFTLAEPAAVVICDALHHIPADAQVNLLRYVYESLKSGGLLIIQDIGKKPLVKYLFARGVDMLLNMKDPVYYRGSDEWVSLLEKVGFKVEAKRLDRGYPIAAIMFKCVKP